MYNWSTDIKRLKQNPEKYSQWRLEQLINFGLGNKKLSVRELKTKLTGLDIDPAKKRFLRLLLNEK